MKEVQKSITVNNHDMLAKIDAIEKVNKTHKTKNGMRGFTILSFMFLIFMFCIKTSDAIIVLNEQNKISILKMETNSNSQQADIANSRHKRSISDVPQNVYIYPFDIDGTMCQGSAPVCERNSLQIPICKSTKKKCFTTIDPILINFENYVHEYDHSKCIYYNTNDNPTTQLRTTQSITSTNLSTTLTTQPTTTLSPITTLTTTTQSSTTQSQTSTSQVVPTTTSTTTTQSSTTPTTTQSTTLSTTTKAAVSGILSTYTLPTTTTTMSTTTTAATTQNLTTTTRPIVTRFTSPNNKQCILPFYYHATGKTYNDCTDDGYDGVFRNKGKYFCKIQSYPIGDAGLFDWAYCKDLPADFVPDRQVTPKRKKRSITINRDDPYCSDAIDCLSKQNNTLAISTKKHNYRHKRSIVDSSPTISSIDFFRGTKVKNIIMTNEENDQFIFTPICALKINENIPQCVQAIDGKLLLKQCPQIQYTGDKVIYRERKGFDFEILRLNDGYLSRALIYFDGLTGGYNTQIPKDCNTKIEICQSNDTKSCSYTTLTKHPALGNYIDLPKHGNNLTINIDNVCGYEYQYEGFQDIKFVPKLSGPLEGLYSTLPQQSNFLLRTTNIGFLGKFVSFKLNDTNLYNNVTTYYIQYTVNAFKYYWLFGTKDLTLETIKQLVQSDVLIDIYVYIGLSKTQKVGYQIIRKSPLNYPILQQQSLFLTSYTDCSVISETDRDLTITNATTITTMTKKYISEKTADLLKGGSLSTLQYYIYQRTCVLYDTVSTIQYTLSWRTGTNDCSIRIQNNMLSIPYKSDMLCMFDYGQYAKDKDLQTLSIAICNNEYGCGKDIIYNVPLCKITIAGVVYTSINTGGYFSACTDPYTALSTNRNYIIALFVLTVLIIIVIFVYRRYMRHSTEEEFLIETKYKQLSRVIRIIMNDDTQIDTRRNALSKLISDLNTVKCVRFETVEKKEEMKRTTKTLYVGQKTYVLASQLISVIETLLKNQMHIHTLLKFHSVHISVLTREIYDNFNAALQQFRQNAKDCYKDTDSLSDIQKPSVAKNFEEKFAKYQTFRNTNKAKIEEALLTRTKDAPIVKISKTKSPLKNKKKEDVELSQTAINTVQQQSLLNTTANVILRTISRIGHDYAFGVMPLHIIRMIFTKLPILLTLQDDVGDTPAMNAILKENYTEAQELIDLACQGGHSDMLNSQDTGGYTILMFAATCASIPKRLVDSIIDQGCRLNTIDCNGLDALDHAISSMNHTVFDCIMKAMKAHKNYDLLKYRSIEFIPKLHRAMMSKNYHALRVLLALKDGKQMRIDVNELGPGNTMACSFIFQDDFLTETTFDICKTIIKNTVFESDFIKQQNYILPLMNLIETVDASDFELLERLNQLTSNPIDMKPKLAIERPARPVTPKFFSPVMLSLLMLTICINGTTAVNLTKTIQILDQNGKLCDKPECYDSRYIYNVQEKQDVTVKQIRCYNYAKPLVNDKYYDAICGNMIAEYVIGGILSIITLIVLSKVLFIIIHFLLNTIIIRCLDEFNNCLERTRMSKQKQLRNEVNENDDYKCKCIHTQPKTTMMPMVGFMLLFLIVGVHSQTQINETTTPVERTLDETWQLTTLILAARKGECTILTVGKVETKFCYVNGSHIYQMNANRYFYEPRVNAYEGCECYLDRFNDKNEVFLKENRPCMQSAGLCGGDPATIHGRWDCCDKCIKNIYLKMVWIGGAADTNARMCRQCFWPMHIPYYYAEEIRFDKPRTKESTPVELLTTYVNTKHWITINDQYLLVDNFDKFYDVSSFIKSSNIKAKVKIATTILKPNVPPTVVYYDGKLRAQIGELPTNQLSNPLSYYARYYSDQPCPDGMRPLIDSTKEAPFAGKDYGIYWANQPRGLLYSPPAHQTFFKDNELYRSLNDLIGKDIQEIKLQDSGKKYIVPTNVTLRGYQCMKEFTFESVVYKDQCVATNVQGGYGWCYTQNSGAVKWDYCGTKDQKTEYIVDNYIVLIDAAIGHSLLLSIGTKGGIDEKLVTVQPTDFKIVTTLCNFIDAKIFVNYTVNCPAQGSYELAVDNLICQDLIKTCPGKVNAYETFFQCSYKKETTIKIKILTTPIVHDVNLTCIMGFDPNNRIVLLARYNNVTITQGDGAQFGLLDFKFDLSTLAGKLLVGSLTLISTFIMIGLVLLALYLYRMGFFTCSILSKCKPLFTKKKTVGPRGGGGRVFFRGGRGYNNNRNDRNKNDSSSYQERVDRLDAIQKYCKNCHTYSQEDSKYCGQCSLVLSPETTITAQQVNLPPVTNPQDSQPSTSQLSSLSERPRNQSPNYKQRDNSNQRIPPAAREKHVYEVEYYARPTDTQYSPCRVVWYEGYPEIDDVMNVISETVDHVITPRQYNQIVSTDISMGLALKSGFYPNVTLRNVFVGAYMEMNKQDPESFPNKFRREGSKSRERDATPDGNRRQYSNQRDNSNAGFRNNRNNSNNRNKNRDSSNNRQPQNNVQNAPQVRPSRRTKDIDYSSIPDLYNTITTNTEDYAVSSTIKIIPIMTYREVPEGEVTVFSNNNTGMNNIFNWVTADLAINKVGTEEHLMLKDVNDDVVNNDLITKNICPALKFGNYVISHKLVIKIWYLLSVFIIHDKDAKANNIKRPAWTYMAQHNGINKLMEEAETKPLSVISKIFIYIIYWNHTPNTIDRTYCEAVLHSLGALLTSYSYTIRQDYHFAQKLWNDICTTMITIKNRDDKGVVRFSNVISIIDLGVRFIKFMNAAQSESTKKFISFFANPTSFAKAIEQNNTIYCFRSSDYDIFNYKSLVTAINTKAATIAIKCTKFLTFIYSTCATLYRDNNNSYNFVDFKFISANVIKIRDLEITDNTNLCGRADIEKVREKSRSRSRTNKSTSNVRDTSQQRDKSNDKKNIKSLNAGIPTVAISHGNVMGINISTVNSNYKISVTNDFYNQNALTRWSLILKAYDVFKKSVSDTILTSSFSMNWLCTKLSRMVMGKSVMPFFLAYGYREQDNTVRYVRYNVKNLNDSPNKMIKDMILNKCTSHLYVMSEADIAELLQKPQYEKCKNYPNALFISYKRSILRDGILSRQKFFEYKIEQNIMVPSFKVQGRICTFVSPFIPTQSDYTDFLQFMDSDNNTSTLKLYDYNAYMTLNETTISLKYTKNDTYNPDTIKFVDEANMADIIKYTECLQLPDLSSLDKFCVDYSIGDIFFAPLIGCAPIVFVEGYDNNSKLIMYALPLQINSNGQKSYDTIITPDGFNNHGYFCFVNEEIFLAKTRLSSYSRGGTHVVCQPTIDNSSDSYADDVIQDGAQSFHWDQ